MSKSDNNYNLEDRTLNYSQHLILFLNKIPKNNISAPLIDQCIRSGTSIGANYREANGASSKKDFFSKIFICKKESKETLYWLELLGKTLENDILKEDFRKLWSETKEFVLIFGKIGSKNSV